MSEKTRRQALQAIGAGVSVVAISTPVVGKNGESEDPVKEAHNLLRTARRLEDQAKSLKKDKAKKKKKKAKKLRKKRQKILDDNNIQFNGSKTTLGNSGGDDGGLSTQDRYGSPSDNDNTVIYSGLYDYNGVTAYVDWTLAEHSSDTAGNPCPPDGAAIYWNNEHWQPVSIGRDNFKDPYCDATDTLEGTGSVEYDEWDISDGGVLAKVNDPDPNPLDGENAKFWGGFSTDLQKVDGENSSEYPIKTKYKHSWQFTGCYTGFDLELSAGAITIGGGGPATWTMPDQSYL